MPRDERGIFFWDCGAEEEVNAETEDVCGAEADVAAETEDVCGAEEDVVGCRF